MNRTRHIAIACSLPWLAIAVVALAGCEDKRRHRASQGVEFSGGKTAVSPSASPVDVAVAFLNALGEAQSARSAGLGKGEHADAYTSSMGAVSSLVAGREVLSRLQASRGAGRPIGLTEEAATTTVTESWVSLAAYYADGFQFDTLTVKPQNPAPGESVTAYVEARRPEDARRLAEIEKSLEGAEGQDGKPLARGTGEFKKRVRSVALAGDPPFVTPITARFQITLKQEEGAWRVAGFTFRQPVR